MIDWTAPTLWHLAALVIAIGALHASFQLGVSMLTSLSAHSFGFQRKPVHSFGLGSAYILGMFSAVLVLQLALTYVLNLIPEPAPLIWAVICGVGVGIGVGVLLFYYRLGRGTMLWLPRPAASYLLKQTKKTDQPFEAFSLGLATVVAELPFIITPMVMIAMIFHTGIPRLYSLSALIAYSLIAILPLLIIAALVGSGKKLSQIQRWREANKGFLQFSAGLGLMVVSIYLFTAFCLGGGMSL